MRDHVRESRPRPVRVARKHHKRGRRPGIFGAGFFRLRVRGVVAPGHFWRLSVGRGRGGMVSGVDTGNDDRQNILGGGRADCSAWLALV